jgi:hypothetical protein
MKYHDVKQGSEEWHEIRLGKATASNFGCFMANYGKDFGEPAKRYALQIALEALTGKKTENGFTNEHMERGIAQEPIAMALYEDMFFSEVKNGGFFCYGTYGDSPDGLVGDNGVLELKSVIASTHYGTLKRGSYDPAYKWQLMGHLDCTGRDWVDFASYCSDFPEDKQLIVYRVYRNDCINDIEKLRERRSEFLELVQKTLIELKE